MAQRNARWRSLAGALTTLALALLAGCGPAETFKQSSLDPQSEFTRMIHSLFQVEYYLALAVFVLVEGALVYVVLRFRGKPEDPEPEQVHGNTMVEVIWTAIPALILAALAVPTVRTIFRTYEVPQCDALQEEVIGHQWWWEFRYPQYGLVTANELHVPTGRTVSLRMITQDVLHSFNVPEFRVKNDAVPGNYTTVWFEATRVGETLLQCTEYCGKDHSNMLARVRVPHAHGVTPCA